MAKIIYAGYSSIKMNYIIRAFPGSYSHHTFIGRKWYRAVPDLIKSCDCDIVICEISPIGMNHFHKYDGYILPVWAQMRINIDRPLSEICHRSVSDFSNVTRRIRKYNLTYEILNDYESFSYFNEKLYLPYIKKRHGAEALVEDLNKIWKSTQSSFLISIKENGIIVAASLIRESGDILYFDRLGLLDGNEEYLRKGVIGALYYFGILEGQKRRCKYFDVGGTRPFLTDGLTKYKMGLGAEFVSDHSYVNEYIWFGVNEHSSVAKEFLCSNPFMYLNKDNRLVRYRT